MDGFDFWLQGRVRVKERLEKNQRDGGMGTVIPDLSRHRECRFAEFFEVLLNISTRDKGLDLDDSIADIVHVVWRLEYAD